jgi:hypothetical protein
VKNEDRCLEVFCVTNGADFEERCEWAFIDVDLSIGL